MDDARDTTYGNPLEMVNLSRNGFISPSEIPGWQNLVTYMGKIWEIYGDLWEIVSGSASHSELEAMDHRNRLFTRNDDFPVRYVNVYQMVNYDFSLRLSPPLNPIVRV